LLISRRTGLHLTNSLSVDTWLNFLQALSVSECAIAEGFARCTPKTSLLPKSRCDRRECAACSVHILKSPCSPRLTE
jgi:hypothetical protein